MKRENPKRWVIGVTGASGIRYALRLIECAAAHSDELHVTFSDAAVRVMQEEEGMRISGSQLSTETLLGKKIPNVYFYNPKDIGARIASGSFITEGMVIIPCSMSTLGAIAHGVHSHLVHRAADVVIKEKRKLIVVPRETPLSVIHLENLLKLANLGAQILPAMPGFYHRPSSIEDLVDMLVMKIMDGMGIHADLVTRWRSTPVRTTVAV